jgi:hypothetical protein
MRDDLVKLLEQKSPQTTAELANKLKLSWHRVHENLLELVIEGRIDRMVVGGRYLWFSKKDKKVYRKGMLGRLASIGMMTLATMAIILIAALPASRLMFSTGAIDGSLADSSVVQSIIESQADMCAGVSCSYTTITCADGFSSACDNFCDPATGSCSSCAHRTALSSSTQVFFAGTPHALV